MLKGRALCCFLFFGSLLFPKPPSAPASTARRLRATATALQLRQGWVLRLPGGFNEQALSNIVYAFDRAQLLDRELLQSVFAVAAMRLDGNVTGQQRPAFKPQELCTLLRAAQTNVADPWVFLGALSCTVAVTPFVFESWSGPERAELHRALPRWRCLMCTERR